MFSLRPAALCVALAAAFPGAAFSAGDADIKQLREQLRELRDSYQQRIDALERRLAETEARAASAASAAAAGSTAGEAALGGPRRGRRRETRAAVQPASESAFNPQVSLIIDSKFTRLQRDPSAYRIDGFIPRAARSAPAQGLLAGRIRAGLLGQRRSPVPRQRALLAGRGRRRRCRRGGRGERGNPGPAHRPQAEGRALPVGRRLPQPAAPHEWDFSDAPLAYKAFFGYRLQNDGVQLRWVAPTDLFLEFGAEAANGGKFPGAERKANGAGLWTAFAHLGGDIGDSSAWRVGLSHVRTQPRERASRTDAAGSHLLRPQPDLDRRFRYKWAPNGNAASVT
jgi:hypothetical protein